MSQQLTPAALADPDILRQYPAGVPPAGVTPNFAHPESRGAILVIVGGLMFALMTLLLANRIYTKAIIVRRFSWDDLTVSLSALGGVALYICCCWEVERGSIGKHQYELHLSDMLDHNIIIPSYIIDVVSLPALWITKLTFFLFYLQIFLPLRWLRVSVYIGASLSTAFYLGVAIALFILASPRRHQSWAEEVRSGRQPRQLTLLGPTACIGLVIDVLLLILPSVAVSQLRINTKRKIGLMLIFGTGLIAVGASAVGIYYRYEIELTNDFSWSLVPAELWMLVEIDVGVMTACLPALSRMLHHHLPPWESLQSRFSLYKITHFFNSGGGSFRSRQENQLEMQSSGKHSRLPVQHHNGSMGPYMNLGGTPEPMHRDDLELGPISTVDTVIGDGRKRDVEEDEIFFKQDIH